MRKTTTLGRLIGTLILCLSIPSLLMGQSQASVSQSLVILPESRLWLEGSSTLHDYSSIASRISGRFERSASVVDAGPRLFDLVEVTIPVKELKSGTKALDRNMYDAMKAKEFPTITFRLVSDTVLSRTLTDTGRVAMMKAVGTLEVAGSQQGIEMNIRITEQLDGLILIDGSEALLMSDFGIEPPSFMFGTLKTDDRIRVIFALKLQSESI